MNILKKVVINNMNEFRESFMLYNLTYILTMLITIAFTICYDNDFIMDKFGYDIFDYLIVFYACSGCLIWLSEIIFRKNLLKISGYIIGIITGIIFSYLYVQSKWYGMHRVTVGFVVIVMCVVIYLLIKNLKVKFSKYILDLFQNVFNYTVMYIVINIGITFLVYIFDALILEDSFSFIIVRLQIFLFGCFYGQALILSFTKKSSHISVFIINMIKYILYPILLVALTIVYGYLIKIIVTTNMPSNAVYSIVSGIFVGGFPTILMLENLKIENKFFNKSLVVLPYLFIPLIVLQIISLVIRCNKYGMTTTRYIAIIFICIEICTIGMYVNKKKYLLDKILLVGAVLTFIGTMTPINMTTVSLKNQSKRLYEAWKEGVSYEELTREEKEIASGAYNYLVYELKEEVDRKLYIPLYLSEKDKENISTPYAYYLENDEYDEKHINVTVSRENMNFDIEKYKEIQIIESYMGKEYKTKMTKLDKKIEAKMKEIIEENGGKESEVEKALNNKKMLEISKNEKVIILDISGTYINKDDEFLIMNMLYEIILLKK